MDRSCTQCKAAFTIHPDEEAFLPKMAFTFGKTKVEIPPPTMCPDCRLQWRTCHRNERNFYRRTDALTGKDIISVYHEEPLWGASYKVYTHEEWNDDRLDMTTFGRDFDFSQPFFEQFAALHKDVPRLGMMVIGNENSDYTAGTGYCKNCYLINSSEYCEDCYYGKLLQSCRDSVDCSYLYDSELCYDCFSVYKSYGCTSLSFSTNCRDCSFSLNLIGCSDCCLCSNLRQKQYWFENKPLKKEEYERRVKEFLGSHAGMEAMRKKLQDLRQKAIHKYANIVSSEGCSGDYIEQSKNCLDCYDVNGSEDSRYVTVGVEVKDNFDCSNMYIKPELAYQTLGTIETYHTAYCLFVFHSQHLLYCEYCFHSKDCFACIGLRRKQFCIFNKQYTKEEYEELVPKIIAHMRTDGGGGTRSGSWGSYFPPSLSPFGYNESLANEYLPLSEEEAKNRGFYWRKVSEPELKVQKTIPANRLPDTIIEIPDEILEWALVCEETGRPFRITRQELDFYRKRNLPVPRLHPDVRYDRRLKLRNPRKLWKRACMKCGKKIETTYAPDRPAVRGSEEPSPRARASEPRAGSRGEMVYCERCYLEAVY